jgi:hypothetical protein
MEDISKLERLWNVVKLAGKTLSTAKQKLRTHDASMWWTKQQHDALKKLSAPIKAKVSDKNMAALRKPATPKQNLSKSLGAVASMKWLKKSDVKGTYELKKAALDKKKSSLSRPTYPKNSDDYYNVNEYYRSRNKYYNEVGKINKEKDKLTKDYKKMISKKK